MNAPQHQLATSGTASTSSAPSPPTRPGQTRRGRGALLLKEMEALDLAVARAHFMQEQEQEWPAHLFEELEEDNLYQEDQDELEQMYQHMPLPKARQAP